MHSLFDIKFIFNLFVFSSERYRDLLKAADTIGEMKNTSQSVTDQISRVMGTCRSLNDQQLLGFKSEPQQFKSLDRQTSNYYGIVVQIKLLTELPELIWTCIDAEDYFVATQLFIFSRHISTGKLIFSVFLLTDFTMQ